MWKTPPPPKKTKVEPRLLGPFPVKEYRNLVDSCSAFLENLNVARQTIVIANCFRKRSRDGRNESKDDEYGGMEVDIEKSY